jgi:hypothetical protein
MQLNNKLTNNFIRIDKIDILQNKIVYSVYETIVYNSQLYELYKYKLKQENYEFKSIDLREYLNQSINFTELCYSKLQSELFKDYVIESGLQNWLFYLKHYRITVNNIQNNKQLAINSEYRRLINGMIDLHQNTIIVQDENTIMYVNTIKEEDINIVSKFLNKWIFVETKI